MQIPILIEPVPGNGYRAQGAPPFSEVGEGETPEAALDQLKHSVQRRLEAGARIVSLDVSSGDHTWLPFAGMFDESDPVVQEWLQTIESRRNDPEAAA